jgi:CHASE1-domain containing sensor protein
MRYLELVLVAEVGLTLTVFAAWTAHLHEQHRRQGIFAQLAASRTLAISQTMRALRDTELEALGRLYENSAEISPEAFYRYTGFLTRSRVVQGWGWAPAVAADDTLSFEQSARDRGIRGFSIWQQDSAGNRMPAAGRQVYYPVFLISPADVNSYAVGFDLGSEPVRRAAIEETMRSRLTTGSEPITLIQDNAGYRALLILRPVYGGGPVETLRGFVFAFLRVEKLLESAGPDTATTRLAVTLLRPDGSAEALAGDGRNPLRQTLAMQRPVLAFDKTFALSAGATQEFLRLHPATGGAYAAVLGVLVTAAITCIFGLMLRIRSLPAQDGAEGRGRPPADAWFSGACSSRNPMPKRRRLPRRVRRRGHAGLRA